MESDQADNEGQKHTQNKKAREFLTPVSSSPCEPLAIGAGAAMESMFSSAHETPSGSSARRGLRVDKNAKHLTK